MIATENEVKIAVDGISDRALNLLARIRMGKFYRPYDPKTPKAMHELIDAGLVATTFRVVTIELCYVPSFGYTPFIEEKFNSYEEKER